MNMHRAKNRTVLDYDTAKLLLQEIAAARPAYVYKRSSYFGCLYTEPDGSPGCIVGHVLHRIGVTIPSETVGGVYSVLPSYVDVRGKAAALLNHAQILQDKGVPWGAAVGKAIAHVEGTPQPGPDIS